MVETLSNHPPEHHCADTLAGLADFRVRFHVTKEDLLPVLAEPIEHTFADGTKIRVAAGVAVPSGAEQSIARGTSITVPVPSERVARSYKPGTPFVDEGGDGQFAPLDGHALSYDGRTLAEDGLFGNSFGLRRFGTTERSDGPLVTVRNPCLEATVRVSAERLHKHRLGLYAMKEPSARGLDPDMIRRRAVLLGVLPSPCDPESVLFDVDELWGPLTADSEIVEASDAGGLGLEGTSRGATSHTVRPGAAIWFADGRSAGLVTRDHCFTTAPHDEGGRRCFDAPLSRGNSAVLALCFAPDDLEGVTRDSSSYGWGYASTSVANVRPATAEIEGSLDKDFIGRIVRSHIEEIRYCYNQALTKDAALAGRITIEFTIGATGSVSASTVADTTPADDAVGTCAVKAVKRWKFPKPDGGGNVVVRYPFVLAPG